MRALIVSSAGITVAAVVLFLVAMGAAVAGHAESDAAPLRAVPRFPAEVTTIDGERLDVTALARSTTVVVVTLKAPWCPVCRRQLERIQNQRDYLADCGVSFIVLAPGPTEELAAIRDEIGFEHPFVADDGLQIARSLGLQLNEDEIVPAIVMLERDLTVGWIQRGRNGRFYGDGALIKKVECWERIPI